MVDLNTLKLQKLSPLTNGHSAALSPTAEMAAVSDGNDILLIDLKSRQKTKTHKGHVDSVFALDYSKDGRWIASGSRDRTVLIWDVKTGIRLFVLGTPAALTPDQLKAPKD